jgi:nicotinamidase-related amidase
MLRKETTALLIIDIQERILPAMSKPEMVIENALKLIKGFKTLNLPVFYTEQYPKGLGPTAAALLEQLQGLSAITKISFSCFGADNLFERLAANKITQVAVAGIEAHVCVQQTALDLIANNFQVNLAADAVSSRKEIDYITSLKRLAKHNVEVTTAESILFELIAAAGTEEFREISKIVK